MTDKTYPPAHLLTLPRELRNRIYTFLTQPRRFLWGRDKVLAPRGPSGDVQVIEPVALRLRNGPFAHVFLIHPQITAEYRDHVFSHLEAVIDPSWHYAEPSHPNVVQDDGLCNAALAMVRHVTVFAKIHARTAGLSLDWADQMGLLWDVVEMTKELVTLRVAVRQQYHLAAPTVLDAELDGVLVPAATRLAERQAFLPKMPLELGDMVLVQRGEGYHVGESVTFRTHFGNDRARYPRNYVLRHGIRKNGVYMYARDVKGCAKRMWTVEEIVAKWPMRKYLLELGSVVGEERARWLEKLPYQMTEWIEMRGVENVKRWG